MLTTSLQTRHFPSDLSNPYTLLITLQKLRQSVYEEGQAIFHQWRSRIQRPDFLHSSLNLACYLALRRYDLRSLQTALMPWGLSCLGQIEARVLPNLDAVIATLGAVCQANQRTLPNHPSPETYFEGSRLLKHHTQDLFGKTPPHRRVRIMVTLPTDAASDYVFVRDLLSKGANCVRINCAHDDADIWSRMIANVRQASQETGLHCRVLMDLAGPRNRIGTVINKKDKERIYRGDFLLLTKQEPTVINSSCFQANCTLPEVLEHLQVGTTVCIGDGRIITRVYSLMPQGVLLQVTQTRMKGERVHPEKGINFPDTNFNLSALTHTDLENLDFVANNADIVGYSFVQTAQDIEFLQNHLKARLPEDAPVPGIVAKIETPQAVSNLPEIIVQAAGKQPFGIMIARGDLAIEVGYQRLASLQEEILCLCEAAHVPVIWATQVLENLVKNGIPSRAEMSDVAMGERAECVMLGKGPFMADAVTILDDVLVRMQAHQVKKTPQLGVLDSW